ncbi:hypothetical protein GCK32_009438, partial [Trichostrongylus colubriformis]
MSAEEMPPNMSSIGKKKKREKTSQPVQPVHPQPHKSPSPEPSLVSVSTMKDDTCGAAAACTILSIEPEGATRDIEQELLLVDAPLFGVNPLHKAKVM